MGLIGGAPAIVGAWIGGFSPSPTLAVLFLAIGTGAVFEVVYEIAKLIQKGHRPPGHAVDRLLRHRGRDAAAVGYRADDQITITGSTVECENG